MIIGLRSKYEENEGMADEINPITSKVIHDADHCLLYGAFVRAGRNALNLSQDELAIMLGINRTTLVRLEKGKPPFKKALCESVVDVFRKIGVTSSQINELAGDPYGVIGTLDIQINFKALDWDFFPSNEPSIEIKAIDGGNLTPPLQEKPLRKDKPKN